MHEVPAPYVAAALLPALIISVLFIFDHSVSSQLAQQPEFNLKKGSAYHYDLLLLAGMVRAQCAVCCVVYVCVCVVVCARRSQHGFPPAARLFDCYGHCCCPGCMIADARVRSDWPAACQRRSASGTDAYPQPGAHPQAPPVFFWQCSRCQRERAGWLRRLSGCSSS